MWNKKKKADQQNQSSGSHSSLSPHTIFQGVLHSQEDIRIDGTMNGNIFCQGKVVIGNGANVTGDIECSTLEVFGSLSGNVRVMEVFLLQSTSCYKGDAVVKHIQTEPGADFSGTCDMLKQNKDEKIE